MIKLSIFMNDPLTAHEMYQKEIEKVRMQERNRYKKKIKSLETEVKRLNKVVESTIKSQQKTHKRYQQNQYELRAVKKKLEE